MEKQKIINKDIIINDENTIFLWSLFLKKKKNIK